jgi:ribosomal protein L24
VPDFIEELEAEDSASPYLRWNDIDRNDNEGALLEELASEIRARYKRVTHSQRGASPTPEYPTPGHPTIWRVRVRVRRIILLIKLDLTVPKKGFERDVVFAVMRKAIRHDSVARISCAFMRDTIPGSIYIEAFVPEAVEEILAYIPGVLRARERKPRMQAIPVDDRIPLLTMSDTPAVKQSSWVRLKTRGLYRNDLAFVLDIDERLLAIDAVVVPRIDLRRKRVMCPNPSLFDLEEVKNVYGNSSVEQRNQIHLFQGEEYKDGLLRLSLPVIHISIRNVNPTEFELNLFSQCTDSSIVNAAYREMARFRVDDRIEVIAGQLRGLEGRIADIEPQDTIIISPNAALDSQPIPAPEIRKKFCLGDRVQVISGEHQGAEGFIIDLDEKCATLYCLLSGELYSAGQGIEVGSLTHIPSLVLLTMQSPAFYRYHSHWHQVC